MLNSTSARRWKVVLIGYFDDSGKESSPRDGYVCIAGYVAGDLLWGQFADLWQHYLMKHGITGIHMKDLIFLQGEYKELGWDIPKRDAVLSDFINVIKETDLIGFGVGVDSAAWRKLVPEELSKTEGCGHAMEFCFSRVVNRLVERMIRVAPRDLLTMIFDCDQAFVGRRFNAFSWIREHYQKPSEYLVSIGFANPKNYIALQAADFLAWQTRKELVQKAGGFDSTSQFKELFALTPGYIPDYAGEFWDEKEIENKIVAPWRERVKSDHDSNAKGKTA